MTSQPAPADPLFAALDPLVREGVLQPQQADRVLAAVSPHVSRPPVNDGRLPTLPVGWSELRLFIGIAALGGSLALASFVAPMALTQSQDFRWKPFLAMAVVTATMGAAAGACHFLLAERRAGRWLTGVFSSLAVLTLALTVMVTWDPDALVYLAGAAMLAGGVGIYWWRESHPATLLAVFGGLVVLIQLFTDTYEPEGEDFGFVTTTGIFVMLFGLAVAAAGWRFSCRNTTGIAGGVIAMLSMLYIAVLQGLVAGFVSAFSGGPTGSGPDVRSDIRLAMVLAVLIGGTLLVAHALTGHIGYLVVAFVGVSTVVAAGALFSSGPHPLRWAFGIGLVGALAVAAGLVLLLQRSGPDITERSTPPNTPASYPGSPPPPHLGPGETMQW